MNKPKGALFIALGVVLIGAALLFALYNEYVDLSAGEASDKLLLELQAMIDARKNETNTVDSNNIDDDTGDTIGEAPSDDTVSFFPDTAEAILNVGGYDCIGYLEIPTLSISLPILSNWDYARLDVAPCRQFGSAKNDDLVIAGHNYRRHFAYLSRLNIGDMVNFYDATRMVHCYTVSRVETLSADAVDAVQNSNYDLVLYTCTYTGKTRTAVFCDRVEEE